jgi:hypothetical protein
MLLLSREGDVLKFWVIPFAVITAAMLVLIVLSDGRVGGIMHH